MPILLVRLKIIEYFPSFFDVFRLYLITVFQTKTNDYVYRIQKAAFKFYCNKTLDNAHSAEVDASATWEILTAQVTRYPQLGTNVESIIQFLGDEPIVDFARRFIFENGIEVFNFGKHKGRAVADVLKQVPQYYDWMMKGDFPMHTKQKLTEIFNRTLLKKA